MRASAAAATHLMGSSSLVLTPSFSSLASNATASASLSALLPPLPSLCPSDLILVLQPLEHEEAAAVKLVRKRQSPPDLYLSPQRWHVTGDLPEVTAATGGSEVPPSLPVVGNSQQGPRQREQDLRTFALRCAESVNSDESSAYFVEAMSARFVRCCVGRWLFAPLPHASCPAASSLVNARIANLDIITQWIKWPVVLHIFASHPDGPPSTTYTPGCIKETHEEKTVYDLDDKGEYDLPKVCARKEYMEKPKKKNKTVANLFTASKVTGIRNHSRYFLLLVLFCTLITVVDSSSKSEGFRQGVCPKPDAIHFLLPAHETMCPLLHISSVHWTHSKRVAQTPQTSPLRETTDICAVAVLVVSLFCCLGPWVSVINLVPVQGKVHKFLFFIRITPVRMWYCTLAMSVNYYVSMVVYGVMSKSGQSCEIWGSNAIYCSIFLLLVAFLCYREKMTFQTMWWS